MRVTLIRHGQTPSNVLGLLDTGVPGPALTDLGLRQAAAIPAALSSSPGVDALFVSPLLRTSLTAEPLARSGGVAPIALEGLSEIEAGELEMHGDEGSVRTYLDTAFAWSAGELDRRMPGGASGHDFFDRFDGAITEIAKSGADHVVVVSHGAAIRAWASARVRGVVREIVEHTPLHNTGAVVFEGTRSGVWDLRSWNGSPLGGASLLPIVENDPTGEPVPE